MNTDLNVQYKNYSDFWPYYLKEHAHPTSRKLHVVGTSCAILLFLVFMLTKNWIFFLAVPIVGYGFAWCGHFLFEKNRPATFRYPIKSLVSDFRLAYLCWVGRLNDELKRYGVQDKG